MPNINLYNPETADLQAQQQRAAQLAAMLQSESMRPIQSSGSGRVSWTQGAAQLAQALMAKRQAAKADEATSQIGARQLASLDKLFPQQAPAAAPMQPGQDISPDQALAASLGPHKAPSQGAPSLTGNPQQDRMIAQQMGLPGYMEMAARRSADPEGFGQLETVMGPDGKMQLVQAGNRGTVRPVEGYRPSPLQQYGRVNPGDFTPESLAAYTKSGDFKDLVRIWAPDTATVGGVPTQVARQAGQSGGAGMQPSATPLSTVDQEAGAKAQIAAAEAGAKTTAQANAERAAGIQNKGSSSVTTLAMLDMADPLIDIATGSATGAAVDKVAGFFGSAPDGAKAIAQLKVLQSQLMLNAPRMEGPQSDRDVQLYREAAGQIGTPTVPRDIKKAAVETIRKIQQKYAERAAAAPGAPNAPPGEIVDWGSLK